MNTPISVPVNCGLEGRFRLIVRDGETGRVTKDTGWFKNLILDQGLNEYGTSANISAFCRVGTSNVAPANSQTALVAQVASTSTVEQATAGNSGAPPYYGWTRTRYRFGIGVAAGNLSEVGVGSAAVTGLFSRALIVDGGGTPVTVTVLPTEVLDVWYELRMYPDATDRVFQIQIGPVLHDCTLRAANITTFQITQDNQGSFARGYQAGLHQAYLYSGAIGPITGAPSTTISSSLPVQATDPYSNNSYRRATKYTWGLAFTGSVRCMHFRRAPIQAQMEFTPPINKTNLNTLELTARITWARYVP